MNVSAVVPLDGRGDLVFCELHAIPLHLHAIRTAHEQVADVVVRAERQHLERVRADVERAGLDVTVSSAEDWWVDQVDAEGPLLVHDPLCPLAPAELLDRLLRRAHAAPATSFAAFRPVTDTVKTTVDGAISATIDRSGLAALTSPVVVASDVMTLARERDEPPPLHDVRALVTWLRAHGDVELVGGPSIGRRVDDDSAVLLLECVDEVGRRVHH